MIQHFRTFIVAHFSAALALGIQLVIVSWMAVAILELPATQVSWVQCGVLLPRLCLLLYSGWLADHHASQKIVFFANVFLAVAHVLAFLLIQFEGLALFTLLLYAFALGLGNAFAQTAKEKIVNQLGQSNLQKIISIAGISQFSAQGLGIALAGLADFVGVDKLLLLQAAVLVLSGVFYLNLPLSTKANDNHSQWLNGISEGLAGAWRNVIVRHVVLLAAYNGFMNLGMFAVVIPLLALEVMQFSSLQFGLLQLSFAMGNVLMHFVILKRLIVYPGQNLLFGLLYSGVIGISMASQPTIFGIYALVFMWGSVAGMSANLGRLIVQSSLPKTHIGRTMSIYQLGLLGMAPLGALTAGLVVEYGSVWLVFRLIGISSGILFCVFLFSRQLWSFKNAEPKHKQQS